MTVTAIAQGYTDLRVDPAERELVDEALRREYRRLLLHSRFMAQNRPLNDPDLEVCRRHRDAVQAMLVVLWEAPK